MKLINHCLIMLLAIPLAACNSGDVAELKKNLGDFQYIGIDPQLSFSIPNAEFSMPENEYTSPTVAYTVNLKQNNKDFPLKKYAVSIAVLILDGAGSKRDTTTLFGDVENGVLSISGKDSLFTYKPKDQAEITSSKFRIEKYTWAPSNIYKPFEPTPEKAP